MPLAARAPAHSGPARQGWSAPPEPSPWDHPCHPGREGPSAATLGVGSGGGQQAYRVEAAVAAGELLPEAQGPRSPTPGPSTPWNPPALRGSGPLVPLPPGSLPLTPWPARGFAGGCSPLSLWGPDNPPPPSGSTCWACSAPGPMDTVLPQGHRHWGLEFELLAEVRLSPLPLPRAQPSRPQEKRSLDPQARKRALLVGQCA